MNRDPEIHPHILRDNARRVVPFLLIAGVILAGLRCTHALEQPPVFAPALTTGIADVDSMYRLALDVVRSNAHKEQRGHMPAPGFILHAGKAYPDTWTRDASYNTMFGVGLIAPELARNSLLCEIMRDDQYGTRIGNADWYADKPMASQYWDAIVWVSGAWEYYLCTGDERFLDLAYRMARNSMRYFEDTEFDASMGLFNGPASYGDGVSAYPLPYSDAGGSSFILDTKARVNGKVIIKALSTNCLYVRAYDILATMAKRFGGDTTVYRTKASSLRAAINRKLWLKDKQRYAYFLDMNGAPDDHMEAMGNALVILFDIAGTGRENAVLSNQYISPNGIPCVWPVFPEYGSDFARHCGTIWPHAQGLWAWACAVARDIPRFSSELLTLTRLAKESKDFMEIYHPITGKPYGGLQSGQLWTSQSGQTWSATAYLGMIYRGIFGIRCSEKGMTFRPMLPEGMSSVSLRGLHYRGMTLDIMLRGSGTTTQRCTIDGTDAQPFVDAGTKGHHAVDIEVTGSR